MKKLLFLFVLAFLFGIFVPAAVQGDLFQPRYILVTESDRHRFLEDTKTKYIIMQDKQTGEMINLHKKYGEIF